ncbi:MAG TPA: apolipoprotein N-acyltransferase [Sulfurovum sp.]|jgi:apolipoprotein N-acyltransferase|nr:MAG: apolipoprotein N-acyltransferase [Sulfurovum sp. 35-42-20]OYZ25807.1 MAG: apolipoprotein N-acyltransferase [Sulfurovum sp. 16-42-52]OYZ49050.1 MAG: apolipoprotein N-acyltransferase [Sulfurovum sp. 24-42-9]OZA45187.1 MAG: apolipoprotein N-acyltransferase [Sulfurovum sp. 17-42-90]OZA59850.1 MAG: apolipoprotein N-acyltransferase [Sulfurovum sp. 39-42-12]HQS72267.1 apolipoprotein N-acyltransferase [Sulfurovum sp.]
MSRVVPWKAFVSKMSDYFNTFVLTRGLFISLLASAFIYLDYWGLSHPFINTLLGLTALYLLLQADKKVWFIAGAGIGLLWFWWIVLSLWHYGMIWAVPIELIIIMLTYGLMFWVIAWISEKISSKIPIPTVYMKALGLLGLSYLHPFSFDWLKPELIFVESYLGIKKWQFALILLGITLSIHTQRFYYLLLLFFAYEPRVYTTTPLEQNIALVTTHTTVSEKWDESMQTAHFKILIEAIDAAIEAKKSLVVLPESVFPVFLNHSQELIDALQARAKQISIVTGGLYWDGKTPRNSAYIFTGNTITVANKVVLVPFGESNPLPDFLSDWVNKVFYDGAVDYKASSQTTDYLVNGVRYRNAICFEATSEILYSKDANGNRPQNMIVLSNNGWFTPSTEPTLQKLLLQYYSKKYGTTIYHAVNMSESYVVKEGLVFKTTKN